MAATATHMTLPALLVKPNVAFHRFRQRRSLSPVRARSSGPDDSSSNSSKEEVDARYVLKLGVGSVAGAAVIKYGSVLVPQVTTPNLPEALFIIIMPVIAAVLILLAKSKTSL